MPQIKIKDQEFDYHCEDSDTVLRGGLRAGLGLTYECNSGGCGSCKFELIEGEVDEIWENAPGLSPRDIRKGKKLACQCLPKTDCTIKINLNHDSLSEPIPKVFNVKYVSRRDLTADMSEFHFIAEEPAKFEPGQYVMMSLPGIEGERAYSMSNITNENGYWRFIIKRMPEGKGSNYLFDQLKEGDNLTFDGPYGLAYLKPEIPRDIVCVAGGSGLSPIMSIIRAAASDSRFSNRKIFMFYGGRGPSDICTPELVSEMENLDTELICYNATSDPELSAQQNWNGECCFVHELVDKTLGDSIKDYEYYFCGPPVMTEAIQRMLILDNKVPFQQVHYDRFF